jgi:cytochrome c553
MYPYASERELPEKDVLAISQYLAKLKLLARLPLIDKKTFDPLVRLNLAKKLANVPRYKGDVGKGARFYNRECASCHGRDGMGRRRGKHVTPRLTGQHSLYLLRQIKWIGKGVRFHDEKDDDELFASYSRKEINDALAYLSILDD